MLVMHQLSQIIVCGNKFVLVLTEVTIIFLFFQLYEVQLTPVFNAFLYALDSIKEFSIWILPDAITHF